MQKRLELVLLHQRGELHPPDVQQGAHGAQTQICGHLADTPLGFGLLLALEQNHMSARVLSIVFLFRSFLST